ncbi:polysaccharide deacetylase family protein [Williamsia sp. D3]|uniref:polysaccharide deacetylase family protein n=1 Tax=Williamsia sp. D3 TaxID=1313067 RepID=UPI0003D3A903|nr:polysaccharide deacetylase family protein [Williamsia sp. D3]ETD31539.1 hypothetical protein W823_19360 [Williamsia sp. D3]
MAKALAPLTSTAALTTTTPPVVGKINRYNATAGNLAVTLPALSGLADGAVVAIQKDDADVTANTVTVSRAGSDIIDAAATSVVLRMSGSLRTLQVVTVGGTKTWRTISSHDPLTALDSRYDGKYPLKSQVVTPTEFKKRRLSTTKTIMGWYFYTAGHGFGLEGAGLDAANSNLNDTADVIRGSQSAKVVTLSSGGSASLFKNITAVDLSAATAIRLYLKYDQYGAGQSLDLYMGKSNFSAYFNKNTILAGGGNAEGSNFPWQAGRWEIVDIPLSDFGANGTAPTWTDISRIQVGFTGPSGVAGTLHIASIEAIAPPQTVSPTIIFTMDDTSLTQKTICAPDLNSRGWPATLYPILDQIQPVTQSSTNWDLPWAKSMHDNYGWEIGAHAWSAAAHGVGMPAMSAERRIVEIESMASWLDANGFSAKTFAWPIGNHSKASEDTVREYFTAAFTATRVLNESACPPRRYAIQRCNAGFEPLADIQAAINKVVADKSVLILCIHDIVSGAAASGGNVMPPAKWTSIVTAVEGAVAVGAQVKTGDNWVSNIR